MTNEQFWEMVANISAGPTDTKQNKRERIASGFWTRENVKDFLKKYQEVHGALNDRLMRLELQNGLNFGLNFNMTYEAYEAFLTGLIGQGRLYYDAVMAAPKLAYDRAKERRGFVGADIFRCMPADFDFERAEEEEEEEEEAAATKPAPKATASLEVRCFKHRDRAEYVFAVEQKTATITNVAVMRGQYGTTAPFYLAQQGKLVRAANPANYREELSETLKAAGFVDVSVLHPDTIRPGDETSWDAYANAIHAAEILMKDPTLGQGFMGTAVPDLSPTTPSGRAMLYRHRTHTDEIVTVVTCNLGRLRYAAVVRCTETTLWKPSWSPERAKLLRVDTLGVLADIAATLTDLGFEPNGICLADSYEDSTNRFLREFCDKPFNIGGLRGWLEESLPQEQPAKSPTMDHHHKTVVEAYRKAMDALQEAESALWDYFMPLARSYVDADDEASLRALIERCPDSTTKVALRNELRKI